MAISIKEPCNEDWSKMTPNEKGAHCQRCALDVIDFTNKTPFEIKHILVEEFSSNKRICGRITNYQLDQLNDEFFAWKNDQESFKATFIFSLLAIFGLGLFSCQHAPSRELIDQLNVETSVLLNEQKNLELELNDSSDRLPKNEGLNSTEVIFWENKLVTMGAIPYDVKTIFNPDWQICTVVYGDFVISGSVVSDPKPEVEEFLKKTTLLDPVSNPITRKPIRNEKEVNRPRIEGVDQSGGKKFKAFIYPNPVDISSRLFIHVFEPVSVKLELFIEGGEKSIRRGEYAFDQGRFQVDLKFSKLELGKYNLKLSGTHQMSVLNFEV